MSARCPCGWGDVYDECCGRLHAGALTAPTAEALMRSRFTASAMGDAEYLLATWHPSTRPAQLALDDGVRWTRLDIVDTVDGGPFDAAGVVEFRAHHRAAGERAVLHERSSFVREDGRWLYLRGDVTG